MEKAAAGKTIDILKTIGARPDEEIDPGEAALLLAALTHPGVALERYRHHLYKLSAEVLARYEELRAAGAENTAGTRLAALKHIIADKHGYESDPDHPDHIQNADLIRLIDRGKGNAVSLSLLYINTAKGLDWEVYPLDIPGYFAVRLDHQGERLIFDPARGSALLQAADLRRLVKDALGAQAELSVDYYKPVPVRHMLIRLQNQIKFRQIENEDYEGALQSVEAMRALDPAEFRLLLDAGVLYARTGRPREAVSVLESYVVKAPPGRDKSEAAYLLEEIRLSLKD